MVIPQQQSSPSAAYIKSISVRGFKSFGEEPQKFTFIKGFNLIVGANGSGKSNILDAISFALCTKTSALRVRYNSELQSTDTKEACEVVLELAINGNSGQERVVMLSATINPDDSRQYRVDGKNKSVKDVKEILQELRLYLEGTGAIVHQSQVTELADGNSLKLLASIISEASGAGRWNAEVEKAQQELKKTRKGLDEIQENIVLLEKIIEKDQTCLKALSRIKQLESEVAFISSQLCTFLSEELLSLRKEIDVKVDQLNSEECRINEQQLILDKRKAHIKELKNQLKLPSVNLESERVQLLDTIAMKEEQKSMYERKLQAAKDANLKLGHLEQLLHSLTEKISYINLQIEQKQGLVSRLQSEKSSSNAKASIHFYLEELKDTIIASEEKMQELCTQQLVIEDSLNFLSAKKETMEKQLIEAKEKFTVLSDLLCSFQTHDDNSRKKALTQQKLKIEGDQDELETRLRMISAELGTLNDIESALPSWPLHSCFRFKKGLEESHKYFLALNIISGSLKKTCVTESTEAAADLLRIWEKAGNISRFGRIWPLDRLRIEDRFHQQKKAQQKYAEGSVILPLEQIEYNVKFEKAMKRVFGGYVISSSDEVAKDLILRHGIWSVTLDGKVNRSGSVTGGWRGNAKSNYIQIKFENDHFQAKLDSANSILTRIKQELEELELSSLKFETHRRQKEDLHQEINNIEEQIKELENKIRKQKIDLEENHKMFAFLSNDMETSKKQLNELKQSDHCIETAKVLISALKMANDDEAVLQGILDETLYKQEKIKMEKVELQNKVLCIGELTKAVQAYQGELQLHAQQLASIENKIEEVKREKEDVKKAEKELEALPQTEGNLPSLTKDQTLDKSDYLHNKRKLNIIMEELKKIKPQEKHFSLDEQIAFNEQIGKLELFKERWTSISESIDILTEGIEDTKSKVQKANEAAYQEIRQSFVECCKMFFPTKGIDLIKSGQLVEDGVKISFCNNKEGSKDDSDGWKSNLEELSGGQRTILSLAFILMVAKFSRSSVYLMDEVDAALDEQNQQNVAKLIKSVIGQDNQIICVSHNITFQQYCDRIIQVSRSDGSTKHVQSHTINKSKISKKSRTHN
ncbi:uncharacterized protein LOC131062169 isoform X2 [Cryptomeria japonica]|uniref:uncharacterized protein LOC131062169 isoform X2 n=1 Tax=Cryptomeria japonica TaxID=3369 RepID=UPI0027DA361B|nr:uncharacterized protein LOC131062169 isoform X2 [Cryptomeria japonica]